MLLDRVWGVRVGSKDGEKELESRRGDGRCIYGHLMGLIVMIPMVLEMSCVALSAWA